MTEDCPQWDSAMVCAGCGAEAPVVYPFRCAHADAADGVDHVVTRRLCGPLEGFPAATDPNPFVAYRALFRSYHVARAHGMTDERYVALVRELDADVASCDGRGFRVTPFAREARLSDELGFTSDGGVWVKDESGNMSGSHKARHLFGIMLYLQVLERVGLLRSPLPPLAIASCGNAALAAAVVAHAAHRELQVFIPPDAPPSTVARLSELGARINVCRRDALPGDPCYRGFVAAVREGALPYCCQGNQNGLTIEGGETLGYEIISALGTTLLDRVIVQVGGGALASSLIQAFGDARRLGAIPALPRFDTVQTRGAFPLKRAYDRAIAWMSSHEAGAEAALRYAVAHRSEFMWPWEQEPRSLAHGILDDETYDWAAVVGGMLATGGSAVIVDDSALQHAWDMANATRDDAGTPRVDHTGVAGLAGLRQLVATGHVSREARLAIIFSGAERS